MGPLSYMRSVVDRNVVTAAHTCTQFMSGANCYMFRHHAATFREFIKNKGSQVRQGFQPLFAPNSVIKIKRVKMLKLQMTYQLHKSTLLQKKQQNNNNNADQRCRCSVTHPAPCTLPICDPKRCCPADQRCVRLKILCCFCCC